MKKNLIISIAFVVVLVFPVTTYVWYKGNKARKEDPIDISKYDDAYISKLEDRAIQELPIRGDIIDLVNRVDSDVEYWYTQLENKITSALGGEEYEAYQVINNVIKGKNGFLFCAMNNEVDYFMGTNCLDNNEMDEYKKSFTELKKVCDEKGITLSIIVGPNKSQVYCENMPKMPVYTEYKRCQQIRDEVNKAGINYIYPIEELKAAKDEGFTYLAEDTHWTSMGAFVAYKKFYESIGKQVGEYQYLDGKRVGGDLAEFIGEKHEYTYSYCNYRTEITNISENHVDLRKGEKYSTYTNPNGQGNCIIVGDSYRESFKQFAAKDFASVRSIHRDSYELPEYIDLIKSLKAGDTLCLIDVERMDYNTKDSAERITNILTK